MSLVGKDPKVEGANSFRKGVARIVKNGQIQQVFLASRSRYSIQIFNLTGCRK